jgi:hypothetical protein
MSAIPIRKSNPPRMTSEERPSVVRRRSSIPPAVRNRASLPPADQLRVEVELNVYSDQPNPRWLLGKANAEALLAQLPESSSLTPAAAEGYCGFSIRVDSPAGKRNVQVFHNMELERWLLNTGRFCLPAEIARQVEDQLL